MVLFKRDIVMSVAFRNPVRLFSAALVLSLQSCALLGVEANAPMAQSSTSESAEHSFKPDPPRISGKVTPIPDPSVVSVLQENIGSVVGRLPTEMRPSEGGDVSLNYIDTDVHEIVRLILGDILKVNYTIDPGFMGTVTIQTPRPLKREALLPTLLGLLEQVRGTITYQNGIFRVGSSDEAVITPLVAGSTATMGSQIVPLRFASARQLATMLTTYVGDGARILGDPTRNVLIVAGSPSARQSVVDLVRVFDVDYLAGQSYALFPAKSGDPTKFATELVSALQLDGDSALSGAIRIVPVEQANAIMVIAQQPTYLDRVSRLIEQLDEVVPFKHATRCANDVGSHALKKSACSDMPFVMCIPMSDERP
jgi:type II secretory pathway component GspD/PulD (secretin)